MAEMNPATSNKLRRSSSVVSYISARNTAGVIKI